MQQRASRPCPEKMEPLQAPPFFLFGFPCHCCHAVNLLNTVFPKWETQAEPFQGSGEPNGDSAGPAQSAGATFTFVIVHCFCRSRRRLPTWLGPICACCGAPTNGLHIR